MFANITSANEQLFKVEAALEDNQVRLRALCASIDRVCMPLNLRKLRDTTKADHAQTKMLVVSMVRSYHACRITELRLQREYERLLELSNAQPLQ